MPTSAGKGDFNGFRDVEETKKHRRVGEDEKERRFKERRDKVKADYYHGGAREKVWGQSHERLLLRTDRTVFHMQKED